MPPCPGGSLVCCSMACMMAILEKETRNRFSSMSKNREIFLKTKSAKELVLLVLRFRSCGVWACLDDDDDYANDDGKCLGTSVSPYLL